VDEPFTETRIPWSRSIMKKRIYVRTKGSLTYGWGHVKRALTLVENLAKDSRIGEFSLGIVGDSAVRRYVGDTSFGSRAHFFGSRLEQEETYLRKYSPDLIIVDMLELTTKEVSCYASFGSRLVIFNDLGIQYCAGDLIVCPQLLLDYPPLCKGTTARIGPKFFIVSSEIRERALRIRKINEKAKSILVVMGGCSTETTINIVTQILEKLKCIGQHIVFVLGHDSEITREQEIVLERLNVELIYGTNKIGRYMEQCDIALASAGYVKYELAALGTPAILLSVVDHQKKLGEVFAKYSKCADYLGGLSEAIVLPTVAAIDSLIQNKERRIAMSKNGKELVDCKGVDRISRAVVDLL